MHCARVLALIVLLVGLVHSFSWDIVVGGNKQLEFYHHGTLTHTEVIPSVKKIYSVTYDPVNYRYIYWITDYEIERARLDGSEREVLITGTVYKRLSLAIDQQTQAIYWTEITYDDDDDDDDGECSIERANFNGKNRTTLYIVNNARDAFSLAVSKKFIYWQNYEEEGIWQLPKNKTSTATKLHSISSSNCRFCQRITVNYTIEEQIQGIKDCNALQGLIPNNSKSESTVSICQNYCFQGECSVSAEGRPTCSCKAGFSGERCDVNACHKHCLNGGVCSLNKRVEPVCQCTAGYDGERCEKSICNEYCLQGNCSVGGDGLPKCSCTTGYSGVRCEENACHKHCLNGGICSLNEEDEPACQCLAGYNGGRCEISADKDNSCDADNSGEGTVSSCHQFCLNNGVCSLNEASEPVCQCTADYEGERCDVPAFVVKWFLYAYRNVPPVALSEAVKSTRASTVV
ncbi:hypothetical protein PYW07_011483 [Mythimna separata]|uniref:EGF-like domain-containing protein n=1 Tax=Mythimna separata TaxID=271217 RepID=A0AAD8DM67_MYTSE|nr:hypothetical protein PYW07_011483 [Mythimna separata]